MKRETRETTPYNDHNSHDILQEEAGETTSNGSYNLNGALRYENLH
jgi:hypothetical protein